jgi:hypothetical protein
MMTVYALVALLGVSIGSVFTERGRRFGLFGLVLTIVLCLVVWSGHFYIA